MVRFDRFGLIKSSWGRGVQIDRFGSVKTCLLGGGGRFDGSGRCTVCSGV